jgi:tetratricopeptide (TPR) repeat protein
VPFDRNQQFVGRDSLLNRLRSALFTEHQPAKFAIYGLGGIGKTQIALELAYRAKETYHNCSVFWVPATSVESLQQAFENIGRQLRVPGLEDVRANVKKLVQRYLNQQSTGQWLLILDNVDEVDMWYTELKPYLPKSPRGCVICTTRNRKVAFKIAEAPNIIEVSGMDEETAMQLLAKSLGIDDPKLSDSRQDALKLLEQLTFLPLAIVQAAAYINENGCGLSEYLSLLEAQEQEVVELLSEDFEDDRRYDDTKNPVATTWLISFQHIQRANPLAAEYLSFMSCVDPKDIPQSLLPPAQSRKKEIDALGMLDAYSFVSRRAGDQALDMHRLVHLATRNWLRKEGRLAEWAAKAMQRLEELFPKNEHQNRSVWRLYLAHALYVLGQDSLEGYSKKRAEFISRVAGCLYDDGRYKEAEPWYLQVIELCSRVFGEERPETLASMANLALTYIHQGRWKDAEELQARGLEICSRVLGEKHPHTLASMNNLASMYRYQGQWKEAEELGVQVMDIRKIVLGKEHPSTLNSMANLALTYWSQGRFIDAEGIEIPALDARMRVLGEEHPDTLTSIANLASMYQSQGRFVDAESLGKQVLDAKKRVLGEEHPDTLISMASLAVTLKSQGRNQEALSLMDACVQAQARVCGPSHPRTKGCTAKLNKWRSEAEAVDPGARSQQPEQSSMACTQQKQERQCLQISQTRTPTADRYPRTNSLHIPSNRTKLTPSHQTQQPTSHQTQRRRASATPPTTPPSSKRKK